jgi:succinate dehydrogenase / fumarate reductase iron-sulfur subunit
MSPSKGSTRVYRFEILRYDAWQPRPARFHIYEVAAGAKTSVLEALLRIQCEQDPSLAFRYACRGAVCGSCAMSINGNLDLACRVQLESLEAGRAVLEPLPHLEIIKDLVVDMEPFWEKYERIRPWLQEQVLGAGKSRMSERERGRIDQYVNCILCGLCYAACPMLSGNDRFAGPAALAKLYRFVEDSRESADARTLKPEDTEDGMWGCRTVGRCTDVCPKDVRPTDGIRGIRRRRLAQRFKGMLGRGPHEA